MAFGVKMTHTFKGELLSSAKLRGEILSVLNRSADGVKTDLETVVSTWDTVRPTFTKQVRYAGGNASVEVFTDEPVFHYLDEGTNERWAKMNYQFEAKTHPGEIYSGAGVRTYNKYGYYTSIRGKRAMSKRNISPLPGIEPREWTKVISDNRSYSLQSDIDDAIYRNTP